MGSSCALTTLLVVTVITITRGQSQYFDILQGLQQLFQPYQGNDFANQYNGATRAPTHKQTNRQESKKRPNEHRPQTGNRRTKPPTNQFEYVFSTTEKPSRKTTKSYSSQNNTSSRSLNNKNEYSNILLGDYYNPNRKTTTTEVNYFNYNNNANKATTQNVFGNNFNFERPVTENVFNHREEYPVNDRPVSNIYENNRRPGNNDNRGTLNTDYNAQFPSLPSNNQEVFGTNYPNNRGTPNNNRNTNNFGTTNNGFLNTDYNPGFNNNFGNTGVINGFNRPNANNGVPEYGTSNNFGNTGVDNRGNNFNTNNRGSSNFDTNNRGTPNNNRGTPNNNNWGTPNNNRGTSNNNNWGTPNNNNWGTPNNNRGNTNNFNQGNTNNGAFIYPGDIPLINRPGVQPAPVDFGLPPITNKPVTNQNNLVYNRPSESSASAIDSQPEILIGPNEDDMSEWQKRGFTEKAERMCNYYKSLTVKKVVALPLIPSPDPVEVNVSDCTPINVPLIIGGSAATIQEFPHMALVGWQKIRNDGYSWKCGGSLISDRYVLTAGHCTYQDKDYDVVSGPPQAVQLGSSYLDDPGALVVKISAVIRHPKYKQRRAYHDIALIKMVSEVTFSEVIRPACLGVPPPQGRSIIATGWGRTESGGDHSVELRSVSLKVWNMEECREIWGTSLKLPNGVTSDSHMCAGEKTGGKDTCQGDSGGPAQIQDGCLWRVVAVTSFGRSCGAVNTPALYAVIPHAFVAAQVFNDQNS